MASGRGVLLLNRAEVERLLDPDALVETMAQALAALSAGEATAPDRIAAASPQPGYLAAMPAFLPAPVAEVAGGPTAGAGLLSTKLVSVFAGNHAVGLPSHQALIALFSAADGTPQALLDGTAITAARTAAVSALSARLLAREDARVLAIIGTGVQARAHLRALLRVRRFTEVRIAGIAPAAADGLAREAAAWPAAPASAGASIQAVATARAAVAGADVVCACTDARVPVIEHAWLSPGAHVTSVGFPGPELEAATIQAGLLAVETRAAFAPYPTGAAELQGRDRANAVELGELIAGRQRGRGNEAQITVLKSVGHGVEDAAAARMVVARAHAEGAGAWFDFA